MPQRIKYLDKTGEPCDMVLMIVKKKSKEIIVQRLEDNFQFSIPRRAVESISDSEKDKDRE